MPRAVKEWQGKTPDSRAPERVRLRIHDREAGLCHLCGLPTKGKKWDLDHCLALINGGLNVESNLKPAHVTCHKAKTKTDIADKAAVARTRKAYVGAKEAPQRPIQSKPFPEPDRAPKASHKPSLPPRSLFGPRR